MLSWEKSECLKSGIPKRVFTGKLFLETLPYFVYLFQARFLHSLSVYFTINIQPYLEFFTVHKLDMHRFCLCTKMHTVEALYGTKWHRRYTSAIGLFQTFLRAIVVNTYLARHIHVTITSIFPPMITKYNSESNYHTKNPKMTKKSL